jgi:hypothetical protein
MPALATTKRGGVSPEAPGNAIRNRCSARGERQMFAVHTIRIVKVWPVAPSPDVEEAALADVVLSSSSAR